MNDARRSALVDLLDAGTAEERTLEVKNEFLLACLEKLLRTDSSNGFHDIEQSSMKEILIKKLLEYREVRNYTAIEKEEEEVCLTKLILERDKAKENARGLFEEIRKKQRFLTNEFSSANIKHMKKTQELTATYLFLLEKLCILLADKSEIKVKLLSNKGKSTSNTSFEIEYKKLVLNKKELENQLIKIQRKIKEKKEKIILINRCSKKLNVQDSTSMIYNCNTLFKVISEKIENIKKESTQVEKLKTVYVKDKKDLVELKKDAGILAYRDIQRDYKETEKSALIIQNQFLQAKNLFIAIKSKQKSALFSTS